MKRSDVICKVLVNTGLAENEFRARLMFMRTFTEDFTWSLSHWDQEVPAHLAQEFIILVGTNPNADVHFLIEGLGKFLKERLVSKKMNH